MVDTVDHIKRLREETGCGVMDCKNALAQSSNNFDKAKELLRKRGLEIAAKKVNREAKEGRVEGYVHMGNKIAVLVEVNCESDFVARNEDFGKFTKDVAMHIAAMNPKYIKSEDVPEAVLAQAPNKDQFIKETCLLNQPFVRDQGMSIQDYLNTLVAKIGENIRVSRFIRYKVGEIE